MKTPEQRAIEMGATHFDLTPNGDSVSLYYKKECEGWFYLSYCWRRREYEWKACGDSWYAELYAKKIEGVE